MMMGVGLLGLLLVGGGLLAALLGGLGLASRKGGTAQWPGGSRPATARQALDERFARGEISADEYETVRAQIER